MRTHGLAIALMIGMTWWSTGCGSGQAEGSEPGDLSTKKAEMTPTEGRVPSPFVEREFWLALSEEPTWHLDVARENFLAGRPGKASQEMAKVAAILNFESRHAHSPREAGLLMASVQELREVARQLRDRTPPVAGPPSLMEMDRVSALALRTIAAHQVTLARDALEAGDGRMAARYITETAKAIHDGFQRGGVQEGTAIAGELEGARDVATQLEMDGNGSRDEGLRTLDNLDSAVKGLGDVLTEGRR